MKMQRRSRWAPVLVAAMGAVGLAAIARAGDADYDTPRQVVTFADLNLDSMDGAAVLYHRIRRAAERVCGGSVDLRELARSARRASCEAQALERAVKAVNSNTLTSLYLVKTGRPERPITVAKGP